MGKAACDVAKAAKGATSTTFTASGCGRQVTSRMSATAPSTTASERTMSATVWRMRPVDRPVGFGTSSLTRTSSLNGPCSHATGRTTLPTWGRRWPRYPTATWLWNWFG